MSVKLSAVLDALKEIAPLELAEEWDNVGLLIEPSKPKPIRRVMLTIDLTDAVADEAIRLGSDAVIAYHPPIFEPLKRLAGRLASLAENRVAVYSPHTALDSAQGGVNDWLADGIGARSRYSIKPFSKTPILETFKLVIFIPRTHVDKMRSALAASGVGHIGDYSSCSFNTEGFGTFIGGASAKPVVGQRGRLEKVEEIRLEMNCSDYSVNLQEIEKLIRQTHPYEEPVWDLYRLEPKRSELLGQGRDVMLNKPISLEGLVSRVKRHLKLKHVRVAKADHPLNTDIEHVCLCAGAGGSVLNGCGADVYLTGEMRHHDVLAANARGVSVILCDHTNTERGYLPVLKKKLLAKLGRGVRIDISKGDREPLEIV